MPKVPYPKQIQTFANQIGILKQRGMTTRRGVFAGGDVAGCHATVVHAMQDAKKVAEGIARYVDAVRLLSVI